MQMLRWGKWYILSISFFVFFFYKSQTLKRIQIIKYVWHTFHTSNLQKEKKLAENKCYNFPVTCDETYSIITELTPASNYIHVKGSSLLHRNLAFMRSQKWTGNKQYLVKSVHFLHINQTPTGEKPYYELC